MNIATFNIRTPVDQPPFDWASRLPRVKQLLAHWNLGIVGLQEARIEQLTDLCADGTFGFVGVGRKDPVERGDGEYSAILYRKDTFEPLESGTFWLSETPDVPSSKSWETAYARICTWGQFRHIQSGKTFRHFNTHLDHKSHLAQKNGLMLIIDRMKPFCEDGTPCFLTGDFNFLPERDEFNIPKQLLNYAVEASETPLAGPGGTFHAFHPEEPRYDAPIDYIYTSKDIKVKSVRVIDELFDGLPPSDHFPVAADIIL